MRVAAVRPVAARKGIIVDPAAAPETTVRPALELDEATLDRLADRVADRLANRPGPDARR